MPELREYVNPLSCREKEYYMYNNKEIPTTVLYENIGLHNEKDNQHTDQYRAQYCTPLNRQLSMIKTLPMW